MVMFVYGYGFNFLNNISTTQRACPEATAAVSKTENSNYEAKSYV